LDAVAFSGIIAVETGHGCARLRISQPTEQRIAFNQPLSATLDGGEFAPGNCIANCVARQANGGGGLVDSERDTFYGYGRESFGDCGAYGLG